MDLAGHLPPVHPGSHRNQKEKYFLVTIYKQKDPFPYYIPTAYRPANPIPPLSMRRYDMQAFLTKDFVIASLNKSTNKGKKENTWNHKKRKN